MKTRTEAKNKTRIAMGTNWLAEQKQQRENDRQDKLRAIRLARRVTA